MKKHDYHIIDNTFVYGLDESIVASGYPMSDKLNPCHLETRRPTNGDMKRAIRLGNAPACSGHDCYLKGIIVQFDLTLTKQAWPEAQRYHFLDFVSSMSAMHMLSKMDVRFISYTDRRIADMFLDIVRDYNQNPTEENWRRMIYSYPSGLLLTARMTTNYLQLKNIYAQRKAHRLPEWKVICDWIESLPKAKELGVV